MSLGHQERRGLQRRLLPQPTLSVALFVTWALAFNSFDPAVLISGLVAAIVIPWLTAPLWPEYQEVERWWPLVRLAIVVLWDIVIANFRVAWLILGPEENRRPHFVVLPVELERPLPRVLLASIISLTPGTVSANFSGDGRFLLIHDLDVEDPEVTVARIKRRYERPLIEGFGC